MHFPSPLAIPTDFSAFRHATESEISKILFNCPNKQPVFYPTYPRLDPQKMSISSHSHNHQHR